MAYPRDPLMTLAEFVEKIRTEFGGDIIENEATGPRGKVRIRNLHRVNENDEIFYTTLPEMREDSRLTPNALHGLLDNLGLGDRQGEFGLAIIM